MRKGREEKRKGKIRDKGVGLNGREWKRKEKEDKKLGLIRLREV